MPSFASFNLSPELVKALDELGYHQPSPVQSRVIPKALTHTSLLCQSQTGSGKTHAYLIPLLQTLDFSLKHLQALIICPSRELARQVYEFAFAFTPYFPDFKVRLITSEVEQAQNTEGLSASPQLIVGTPGRLKDILSEKYALDLRQVKTLVLDEADMLCEMGYFDDIDEIYAKLNEDCATMVFSATLEENLKSHLTRYIGASYAYDGGESKTAVNVRHHLVDIKAKDKFVALTNFLQLKRPYLGLVFASKKEDLGKAYEAVKKAGLSVITFHGDLSSRERKSVLRRIKDNEFAIIVCSDLLSRGIDLPDVDMVISLDLPSDLAYYYHRAGRSGRFGKEGDSYIFYDADHTALPRRLIEEGVTFSFEILRPDHIEDDPVGLLPKRKLTAKKPFSEEERIEVKKAKALAKEKKVKPGYKKRQNEAVEKVKRKYRRKAIDEKVKQQKAAHYRAEAKKHR